MIRDVFTMACVAACVLLTDFFRRRWHDRVFRAFTVFFALTGMLYLGIFMTEATPMIREHPSYTAWRSLLFRGGQAGALWYLLWAIRPR